MRSELLYRLHWEYRERWRVETPRGGPESMGFAYVEGVVHGRLEGRFRGTNHARMRSDATFLPDVQGVIQGRDDLTVLVDYQGYGCPYPRTTQPLHDRTRVVLAARHWSDDPQWSFLNDSIAIGVGENRFTEDGVRLLLLDVHEILWEPLPERPTVRPELPDVVPIAPGYFDLDAIERGRVAASDPGATPGRS